MESSNLIKGIKPKFNNSRIVFWHDPEGIFLEDFDQLKQSLSASGELPSNLKILNMCNESVLQVKKLIEFDEPQNSFLLYFPHTEPGYEDDWLLDIRLYSQHYFADQSGMILNELGIINPRLRTHLNERKDFFSSTQRTKIIKKMITKDETELSLDQKMIAVITKSESHKLESILLSLLKDYANSLNGDHQETSILSQISKFNLEESLFNLLSEEFGYESDNPSFSNFVIKLFCTDFWNQVQSEHLDWIKNNLLSTDSGKATATALMKSWRDRGLYTQYFKNISDMLSTKLEIFEYCCNYTPAQLIKCETFEVIERIIIKGLVQELLENNTLSDRNNFILNLSIRSGSYWTKTKKEYGIIYEAIKYAEEIMNLRIQFEKGFQYSSAFDIYVAYKSKIYRFDQVYRLYKESEQQVQTRGADILRKLGNEVEKIYSNWYLNEIGTAWEWHIENENFLEKWKFPLIQNQYDFYDYNVNNFLKNKQNKRIFVIVSDALRFEIAQELHGIIDYEKRFKTEISTQLGVLPSFTQLGMAALLPHTELCIKSNNDPVIQVDGISAQGLKNRNSILQKYGGMAVSTKDVSSWSNEEGRKKVKSAKVIYIYHNTIDAIGDKMESEERTFIACRTAINELKDLVVRIINGFNGNRVVITSDHGFLFRSNSLAPTDKTSLKSKPVGSMIVKKRYIMGNKLPSDTSCWSGSVKYTANSSCETEFLLPKGAQRFHFMGGAKFVHGGAMLQEVCIPVIHVQELQKNQAKKHEKKAVGVIIEKEPVKFVNNINLLKFIQTDSVGGAYVERELIIYITDSEGNEVSSRERILFDSCGKEVDDRIRETSISLRGSNFMREKIYNLVLKDAETDIIYKSYHVTIDLAIQDDFFDI